MCFGKQKWLLAMDLKGWPQSNEVVDGVLVFDDICILVPCIPDSREPFFNWIGFFLDTRQH